MLLNYVREALDKGAKPEHIINHLEKNGYEKAKTTALVLSIEADYKKEKKLPEPKLSPTKRNPFLVLLYSIITLGVYFIYWLVITTNELKEKTDTAPNPWLIVLFAIPYVGIVVFIYYFWKFSYALEKLSGYRAWILFIAWVIVTPAGLVLSQYEINKIDKI